MKDPKRVTVVKEGATYELPRYKVTDYGIEDGGIGVITFCKGNKEDESVPRQTGFFTESLIQVAKEYLTAVNKGEMETRETTMAITKLDEALMWIDKRKQDREERGVLSTYKP